MLFTALVLTGFEVVVDFGVVVVVELVFSSVELEFPAPWSSDAVSFDSLFLQFNVNVRAFNSCNLHVNTVVPPKPSVNKVSDDE